MCVQAWYFSVLEKLETLGCVRSKVDFGVFIWFENGILSGILETHVDDFLWAGTSSFAENVINNLCQSFNIGSQFQETFIHLGLNIAQCDDKIYVDQITYIQSIESIDISTTRLNARGEYCTQKESHSFRKLVGKLNWVGGQTRPDILFNVCFLSSVIESPRISDLILANKVVRKLKDHPVKICYPGLGDLHNCQIMEYSDASLANLPSGKSVGGYVLFIANTNSYCCPILWKSNTIKRVVRSTLAAETCAAVDGLDAGYFLQMIIQEMCQIKMPLIAYTDHKPLWRNAYSTTMVEEHRLRVDVTAIKEMILKGELLQLTWIPKANQLADCLTKKAGNSLPLLKTLERGKLC